MKRFGIILLILLLSALLSFVYADSYEEAKGTFVLPSSVQIIEDEAFSGTAAEDVILSENVESIGKNAFSENSQLSDIYIPETTVHIADSAFDGSEVTIHGIEGSYADEWAQEHGVRFVHEDIWLNVPETNNPADELRRSFLLIEAVVVLVLLCGCSCRRRFERSRKRMKDYPELYVIDLVFP